MFALFVCWLCFFSGRKMNGTGRQKGNKTTVKFKNSWEQFLFNDDGYEHVVDLQCAFCVPPYAVLTRCSLLICDFVTFSPDAELRGDERKKVCSKSDMNSNCYGKRFSLALSPSLFSWAIKQIGQICAKFTTFCFTSRSRPKSNNRLRRRILTKLIILRQIHPRCPPCPTVSANPNDSQFILIFARPFPPIAFMNRQNQS